jgi:hypothetical protein
MLARTKAHARVLREQRLAGMFGAGSGYARLLTYVPIATDTTAEILPFGITLNECGPNLVCYNSTSCCTNGGPIYYINPATGEVKDASAQNGDTASVTWWDIGSSTASSISQVSGTPTPVSQSTLPVPASSSASATSSPTSSATARSDTSGLSTGASAGIGIGVAAAVAGVAALGWLWYRRRKASRAGPNYPELGDDFQHQGEVKRGPETTIYQMEQPVSPPQELDHTSRRVQELP